MFKKRLFRALLSFVFVFILLTIYTTAYNFENVIDGDHAAEDLYAGVYIGIDGVLVVNYISSDPAADSSAEKDLERIKAFIKNDNVRYRLVEHNLRTLEETNINLRPLIGKYGIRAFWLCFEQNAIVVSLHHRDDIDKILAFTDCKAVIFEDSPKGFESAGIIDF